MKAYYFLMNEMFSNKDFQKVLLDQNFMNFIIKNNLQPKIKSNQLIFKGISNKPESLNYAYMLRQYYSPDNSQIKNVRIISILLISHKMKNSFFIHYPYFFYFFSFCFFHLYHLYYHSFHFYFLIFLNLPDQ